MPETAAHSIPSKVSRHSAISRLLAENVVCSQGALQELLGRAGFTVTQATLSRDLEELSATKVRDREGNLRYVLGGAVETGEIPLPLPGSLQRWCSQVLIGAEAVKNQVVLRTPPAAASALGAVIDKENLDGVLGCIAGDDTVLVICSDERQARLLQEFLMKMANR